MNIVSTAMNFVGPAIIDKIARSLGINSTLARTAIATALPAIMAALSGKGSSAQGAGSILDMVRDKGASTLQNLDGMFGGPDEARHVENGRRDLDSVLGSGEMGPIMQAVSRFTGIEEEQSKSLFGMMAPVALGTVGEEASRQKLDAAGLSRMLSDQQANIASALPDGFADHVTGSSTFDSFRSNLLGAGAAGTATVASTHADTVDRTTTPPNPDYVEPVHRADPEPVKKSGGMLWPLLGLLALLAAGWYVYTNFMGGSEVERPAGIEQSLGTSEIGGQLTTSVDNIKASLGSITDEASARAALPDLTTASENLENVQEMAGNLPEAARGPIAGMVSTAMTTLEPLIEKVRAIPGVGPIVDPILEKIVGTMEDLG